MHRKTLKSPEKLQSKISLNNNKTKIAIPDSPVSPITSIAPLIFVIAVTAAKQGYENYLKYKADNMVNKSFVTVIRNGKEEDIQCEDIQQGDLVKVSQDCDVPCDLVLLKSSEESGKCFITTANLDGETNLKTLLVPKGLPDKEIEGLCKLGHIVCEHSKTDLYSFSGRIELDSHLESDQSNHAIPLMAENVLLRGSRVRNTEWIVACAVYTGQNTKLALNSKLTRNKMTSSEKIINKYLLFFLVIFMGLVIVSAALK
jgi:phospholipid-translocating ATPase